MGPQGIQGPAGQAAVRAGTATIPASASTVTVTMSNPFSGSPTTYVVTATLTKIVNWGTDTTALPIFVITGKTATTFVINSVNLSGTAVAAPTGGVTIDWIATPVQ